MEFHHFGAKFLRYTNTIAKHIWEGFSTMAAENKVPRLTSTIGTHSGVFHCDEAFACFMLKQLPEYKDAAIIRTRDNDILKTCDIVVDVGAVYDPKIRRFDHHQRDFNESLSSVLPHLAKNKFIKLSSAGLIYAHYGIEVISEILSQNSVPIPTKGLQNIFLHIYDGFVEELDAIDNGVPMYSTGKPAYRIGTHLSARIHRLNPEWNMPHPESSDKLFEKAMELTGVEFKERVLEAATVWWPARQIVRASLDNRKAVHESGEVIFLERRCPWKEHLFALEEELGIPEAIKFIIFGDDTGSWRVQGIPVQPDSFVCRVFLHKDWRGVRDENLTEIAGIPDCMFTHATGFIGGNKTKEGAIAMALKSLNASQADKE